MKRITQEPAYVLHRRSYRETSFIIELFTPQFGRIAATAKGARQTHSGTQGLLQPFTPLVVSLAGRGELLALSQVDSHGGLSSLKGDALFAGFYLNELIMALLQKWDAHPALFAAYNNALQSLQSESFNERILRQFERVLLEELGYGLFQRDGLEAPFRVDKYYRFMPEQGFVISELGENVKEKATLFSGRSLLAIAQEDWQDEEGMKDAKRLTRLVLAPLLAGKPLHSRKLFMQPVEASHHEE